MNNRAPGQFAEPFNVTNTAVATPVFKCEPVNLTAEEEAFFPAPPAGGIVRIGNLIIGIGAEVVGANAPACQFHWLQKDQEGNLLGVVSICESDVDDLPSFKIRDAAGNSLFTVRFDDESVNIINPLKVNGIPVVGDQQPYIGDVDPSGDQTIDNLNAVVAALRAHGLIKPTP